MKNYKLLVANFLLLITSCFFLSGCLPKRTSTERIGEVTPIPTNFVEKSIFEKPLVSLIPTADGHWVTLEVKNIRPEIKVVDYELIYFAGEVDNKVERGVAGSVELKGETSLSRKILFGSESCTVTCRYKFDENVSKGVLTLKLRSDSGSEKYESSFRLQKGSEAGGGLGTGDGNFKFVSTNLPKNSYFLTISTFGVPEQLTGKIAALPYGIFPSNAAKGEVAFKTSDGTTKIIFWEGTKWQELKGTLSDGWLRASVQKTGIFALIK